MSCATIDGASIFKLEVACDPFPMPAVVLWTAAVDERLPEGVQYRAVLVLIDFQGNLLRQSQQLRVALDGAAGTAAVNVPAQLARPVPKAAWRVQIRDVRCTQRLA